jgi:hypothetical protein
MSSSPSSSAADIQVASSERANDANNNGKEKTPLLGKSPALFQPAELGPIVMQEEENANSTCCNESCDTYASTGVAMSGLSCCIAGGVTMGINHPVVGLVLLLVGTDTCLTPMISPNSGGSTMSYTGLP